MIMFLNNKFLYSSHYIHRHHLQLLVYQASWLKSLPENSTLFAPYSPNMLD